MAKFKVIHRPRSIAERKYHDAAALNDLISYIQREDRTEPSLIGGLAVNPFSAAEEMEILAKLARKYKGVHLRHFVVSFSPEETQSPQTLYKMAGEIAEFYADEYQIVYAVHCNKTNLHIHFVMNTVSYQTGMKYPGNKKDFYDFQTHIRSVLRRYGFQGGLQVVKDSDDDSD